MTVEELIERLQQGLRKGEFRPDTEVLLANPDDPHVYAGSLPVRRLDPEGWGGSRLVIR